MRAFGIVLTFLCFATLLSAQSAGPSQSDRSKSTKDETGLAAAMTLPSPAETLSDWEQDVSESLGYDYFDELFGREESDSSGLPGDADRRSSSSINSFPGNSEEFSALRYNRVDGLFIGVGSDKRQVWSRYPDFLSHFSVGYSFGSHYWQAQGGLAYQLGDPEGRTIVGAEAHRISDTHEAWKMTSGENTAHALLAREDYRNYFRRAGWSAYAEQHFAFGLSLSARYQQDRYESLPRSIDWSLFGGDKNFRDNPQFEAGTINSLIFALNIDGGERNEVEDNYWRAAVQTELGRNDYNFEQYLAEVAHSHRIEFLTLRSRLRVGATTGEAPLPKLYALGGIGSLPGFNWNEFNGNRMALFSTELQFNELPDDVDWLTLGFQPIVFADAASITQSAAADGPFTKLLPERADDIKFSIGAGLASSDGAFRIGAAWRTDIAAAPNLVLRFTPAW